MKNIIITGATSFIGVRLLQQLEKTNNKTYAVVRPNSVNRNKLMKFSDIEIIELAQENISELKQYVDRCDVCYHLAWSGTRGLERLNESLQKQNFNNTINTFQTVKELGCTVFIGAGSQAEFGNITDVITEETPPRPMTAYGKYKLESCIKLNKLAEINNMRFVWGRIFSLYGEEDFHETLIMQALEKMKANETLDMTEGTQYWNYLYVGDLVKLLIELGCISEAYGIFNLASNDTRLLKEYILEMKQALDSESEINFGAIPYRKEGKMSIRPSINKLLKMLPDRKYDFEKFKNVIVKI